MVQMPASDRQSRWAGATLSLRGGRNDDRPKTALRRNDSRRLGRRQLRQVRAEHRENRLGPQIFSLCGKRM